MCVNHEHPPALHHLQDSESAIVTRKRKEKYISVILGTLLLDGLSPADDIRSARLERSGPRSYQPN